MSEVPLHGWKWYGTGADLLVITRLDGRGHPQPVPPRPQGNKSEGERCVVSSWSLLKRLEVNEEEEEGRFQNATFRLKVVSWYKSPHC